MAGSSELRGFVHARDRCVSLLDISTLTLFASVAAFVVVVVNVAVAVAVVAAALIVNVVSSVQVFVSLFT